MTDNRTPKNPLEDLFTALTGGGKEQNDFSPLDLLGSGGSLNLGDFLDGLGDALANGAENFNPAEKVAKFKDTFAAPLAKDLNENHKYTFPLPGVPAENVSVEILDGVLTVTAQHDNFNDGAAFKAAVKLAVNADASGTSSIYKDGLLVVTVPNIQPEVVKVDVKVDSE